MRWTHLAIAGAALGGLVMFLRPKLSAEQLMAVMPNLSPQAANDYIAPLRAALSWGKINTPARIAAFLAQIAHESGELRYWQELASGNEYEGRTDLGNTQSGDGVLFKGRGPIQLTGRANYQAAGDALGLDLVNSPDQVLDPSIGFKTSAWFWQGHGLNELADDGDFETITRRINGGLNGEAQRLAYYNTALEVMGLNS